MCAGARLLRRAGGGIADHAARVRAEDGARSCRRRSPRPARRRVGNYVWNILEPTILAPDYQALLDRDGRTGPVTITKPQDYGELKRHEWEFQHHTAFAYGILSPDKQTELACVYINPSPKAGLRRDGAAVGDEAGRGRRARAGAREGGARVGRRRSGRSRRWRSRAATCR